MDTNRFKSTEYKRQLRHARAYKRTVTPVADEPWRKFFASIGLGTLRRQIIVGTAFVAVVYFIYFAPFMMITRPEVQAASPQTVQDVQDFFSGYRKSFSFIFPQKNILFFSKSRFTAELLQHNPKLSGVESIQRKAWRHLAIAVSERMPMFTFEVSGNYYLLNSDGTISVQIPSPDQSVPLLVDDASDTVSTGKTILNAGRSMFAAYIRDNFSKAIPLQIDRFELSGIYASDFTVVAKGEVKFYLNADTDPKQALAQLSQLWQTLTPYQQQKLAYLDLRFDPKAYGCLKTDKCANQQVDIGQGTPPDQLQLDAAQQPAPDKSKK